MPISTSTADLTVLQAVNEMLKSIGKGTVNSLDSSVLVDSAVNDALQFLSNTSVQVQASGWHFNTDEDYPLTPSSIDGTIPVPAGATAVNVGRRSADRFMTIRQNKLYDLEHHTFNWSNTIAPVAPNQEALGNDGCLYVDITWTFVWEDLPQYWRFYIMCLAANKFAVGRVPNEETFKFTQSVVADAFAQAVQQDQESRALVAAQNPHYEKMRRGRRA